MLTYRSNEFREILCDQLLPAVNNDSLTAGKELFELRITTERNTFPNQARVTPWSEADEGFEGLGSTGSEDQQICRCSRLDSSFPDREHRGRVGGYHVQHLFTPKNLYAFAHFLKKTDPAADGRVCCEGNGKISQFFDRCGGAVEVLVGTGAPDQPEPLVTEQGDVL